VGRGRAYIEVPRLGAVSGRHGRSKMGGKGILDLPLLQPVHVEMDAIWGAQWLVTGRAGVE
jgi:hypothetical protein